MKPRITLITLGVDNLERAVRFSCVVLFVVLSNGCVASPEPKAPFIEKGPRVVRESPIPYPPITGKLLILPSEKHDATIQYAEATTKQSVVSPPYQYETLSKGNCWTRNPAVFPNCSVYAPITAKQQLKNPLHTDPQPFTTGEILLSVPVELTANLLSMVASDLTSNREPFKGETATERVNDAVSLMSNVGPLSQMIFYQHLLRVSAESGLITESYNAVTESRTQQYSSNTDLSFSSSLQAGIIRTSLTHTESEPDQQLTLEIVVLTRLRPDAAGTVVRRQLYTYFSKSRSFSTWKANDGEQLRKDIAQGFNYIAEAIVDDIRNAGTAGDLSVP